MTAFRFEVRQGPTGTDRNGWPAIGIFDSGADASASVSRIKDASEPGIDPLPEGYSLAIVRVAVTEADDAPVVDWRERERERFASGRYKPLPEGYRGPINSLYPDHFAHVADSDSRKVAFTESEERGKLDRQKVLSAEEYMSRYFSDHWYGSAREAFCLEMRGESYNLRLTPLGNADEMQRIYEECGGTDRPVGSCMGYNEGHFASSVHPVRVYALGGDLTLAYIRRDDEGDEAEDNANNPIVARCLVWPEKKLFGRVYCRESYGAVLKAALRAKGCSERNTLSEARLGVIHEGGDDYVMPYIDGCRTFGGDPEDGFFIKGDFEAANTNGLATLRGMATCDRCEERFDEEDLRDVYISRHETESWCGGCRDLDAFRCEYSEEYVTYDERSEVYVNGRYGPHVDYVASWHLDDFATYVESRNEYWRSEDVSTCEDCGEAFLHAGLNEDGVCASCQEDRIEAAEAEARANPSAALIDVPAAPMVPGAIIHNAPLAA